MNWEKQNSIHQNIKKLIYIAIVLAGSVGSQWTKSSEKKKQSLIDEDTCWKFEGDEISRRTEGLVERLSFEVKGGDWDLIPVEESKFY